MSCKLNHDFIQARGRHGIAGLYDEYGSQASWITLFCKYCGEVRNIKLVKTEK
jgi:hypothetical protein